METNGPYYKCRQTRTNENVDKQTLLEMETNGPYYKYKQAHPNEKVDNQSK